MNVQSFRAFIVNEHVAAMNAINWRRVLWIAVVFWIVYTGGWGGR